MSRHEGAAEREEQDVEHDRRGRRGCRRGASSPSARRAGRSRRAGGRRRGRRRGGGRRRGARRAEKSSPGPERSSILSWLRESASRRRPRPRWPCAVAWSSSSSTILPSATRSGTFAGRRPAPRRRLRDGGAQLVAEGLVGAVARGLEELAEAARDRPSGSPTRGELPLGVADTARDADLARRGEQAGERAVPERERPRDEVDLADRLLRREAGALHVVEQPRLDAAEEAAARDRVPGDHEHLARPGGLVDGHPVHLAPRTQRLREPVRERLDVGARLALVPRAQPEERRSHEVAAAARVVGDGEERLRDGAGGELRGRVGAGLRGLGLLLGGAGRGRGALGPAGGEQAGRRRCPRRGPRRRPRSRRAWGTRRGAGGREVMELEVERGELRVGLAVVARGQEQVVLPEHEADLVELGLADAVDPLADARRP